MHIWDYLVGLVKLKNMSCIPCVNRNTVSCLSGVGQGWPKSVKASELQRYLGPSVKREERNFHTIFWAQESSEASLIGNGWLLDCDIRQTSNKYKNKKRKSFPAIT